MKSLILFLLLIIISSCSQKYMKYPYIEKESFENIEKQDTSSQRHNNKKEVPPMIKGKFEKEKFCIGQILFNKNAFDITESSTKSLVRQSCPNSPYLVDAKITKRWWSVLVYTRSCVIVESYCPKPRPTKN